jgi:hypothetical protein
MLALFETPAGYAVFQIQRPDVLKDIDTIHDHFDTAEKAQKLYVFRSFCLASELFSAGQIS